jgi:BMFP domain-containing protein YqiC
MNERPKFFDDLAGVAGGALSALTGLREEMVSMVRARVDEAVRRLDLVKREEFEAMSEVARRAKAQVEALEARVARLEVEKTDITPEPDDITG